MIVIAGNVLAIYPAFFVVSQWLEQFAFRIPLNAFHLFSALLPVLFYVWRA